MKKHKEKAKSFYKDFKTFINRGNVINLAIAIIIGGSFGKIVTSLVNDILTPLISWIFGAENFNDLRWVLKPGVPETAATAEIAEVAIRYGAFIQTILDFLIIAFFIFLVFRIITRASESIKTKLKKNNAGPVPPPEPPKPTQEELLTQIRDLLAESKAPKDTAAGTADIPALET